MQLSGQMHRNHLTSPWWKLKSYFTHSDWWSRTICAFFQIQSQICCTIPYKSTPLKCSAMDHKTIFLFTILIVSPQCHPIYYNQEITFTISIPLFQTFTTSHPAFISSWIFIVESTKGRTSSSLWLEDPLWSFTSNMTHSIYNYTPSTISSLWFVLLPKSFS